MRAEEWKRVHVERSGVVGLEGEKGAGERVGGWSRGAGEREGRIEGT